MAWPSCLVVAVKAARDSLFNLLPSGACGDGLVVSGTSAISPRSKNPLPRAARIAKRREFLDAYERGEKMFGRYSVLFVVENTSGSRIGVTATKKVGKANVRNRMKRWVREVFRHNRTWLPSLDFVVNLKTGAPGATFREFSSDLEKLFRRTRTRGPVGGA